MVVLPFTGIEDSPLFWSRCAELEATANSLKQRTGKLVAGASVYAKSLEDTFQKSLRFADCLEVFCDGDDEESLLIGAPILARYAQTLRELASFIELLRTQLELFLGEPLQQRLNEFDDDIRQARKQVSQRSSEYNNVRLRHLGHRTSLSSPWSGSKTAASSPDKTQKSLLQARVDADDARFALARKLLEARCQTRYEFLESISSAMASVSKFFEHGQDVAKTVEPYIQETLQLAVRLKEDGLEKQHALEQMILAEKQTANDSVRNASPPSSGAKSEVVLGPLQMSLDTTALATELEKFIWATRDSGGKHITVLRQGWLLKQSSTFKSKWQRRFFVLDSTGTLYYYSSKVADNRANILPSLGEQQKHPRNTVNLLTSTIKPGGPLPSTKESGTPVPFTFRIVSPEREYFLQAEDDNEARGWMNTLQGVIACLISDVVISPRETDASEHMGLDRNLSTQEVKKNDSAQCRTNVPAVRILAQVPGNDVCADCGASNPAWASLNLGSLICIECAGFHRKIGSHISKVRSLNLDTKVWDNVTVRLFERLGNALVNSVWEENLPSQPLADKTIAARTRLPSVTGEEEWVWGDGSDGGDDNESNTIGTTPKPRSGDSAAMKERFITTKYVERAFISKPAGVVDELTASLWDAVVREDVAAAYRALSLGALPTKPIETANALSLVEESRALAVGLSSQTWASGPMTALHAAARGGDPVLVELLLQWCPSFDEKELCRPMGGTPLAYALVHDRVAGAKQLLRRTPHSAERDSTMLDWIMHLAGDQCRADREFMEMVA